jgi:phage terminase large subunit-like protein
LQRYRDMGPAVNALEFVVIERKLMHPNNPVLNWNMSNAMARVDPAGNRKLDKDKVKFRIDGAVASVMLLGLRARDCNTQKSVNIEVLIG